MVYQTVSFEVYLNHYMTNEKLFGFDGPQLFPDVKYRHYVSEDLCIVEFPSNEEYLQWSMMYG